ncbi:MAG TPA: hypothetical protein VK927_00355 [Adhaeribacter sp.]|nr:hypothetical protein [Adhaeribacter sp.]
MKKIFLSLLIVFATVSGFAQGTKTKTKTKVKTTAPAQTKAYKPVAETPAQSEAREKMAREKGLELTENMNKNLRLSPKQFEEVLKINRKSISDVELAKVQHIKNLKKMNAEIQSIGSSRMSLLKDVLTPQQFDAYNRKREQKMGIPQDNPGRQPGLPPMQDY